MDAPTSRLLSNRNFVLLWCAYAVSALGDHLSEMAVLKTQNALADSVDVTPLQARMRFAFMLPFFVLGPLMGSLADRLPRRALMILADLARVVLMFNFAWLIARFAGWGKWGPFVPMLFVGVFAAMFSPARSSMLPTLVESDQLVPANAMINGLGMIATMFSAVIGGVLADYYPAEWAFRLDAVTFAVSAALVFGIRARGQAAADEPRRPWLADLADGVRYVRGHRRVGQLLVVAVVFWFAAAIVDSVVPAIVKTQYDGEFIAIALFRAWLGIGLIVGALVVMGLGTALRGEMAITWGLLGVGAGLAGLVLSVFLPLPAGAAHVLGAVSVVLAGIFGAAISASYNALLQRIVPDRYRGRIFGLLDNCTIGGLLIATGWLGIPKWRHIDAWVGYVLVGVCALVVATSLWTLRVRLRTALLPASVTFWSNLNDFFIRVWYRMKVIGPCTIPRQGPVILTANHVSSPDPLYLWAACRYRMLSFMVAAEFTKHPIARYFTQLTDCIPVRREENDIGATKAALRHLKDGKVLGIFIEGRIRRPDQPPDLKDGVAMLALRTGAPVIPVHISGATYFDGLVDSFKHRHGPVLRFGPPVDLSEFAGDAASREALRVATEKIYAAIQSLAPATSGPSAGGV